jgi:hypothetical protein
MQTWRRDDHARGPEPTISTGLVVISRIPSIQLDSLGQQFAIWMYSFASMDLQLFSLNF